MGAFSESEQQAHRPLRALDATVIPHGPNEQIIQDMPEPLRYVIVTPAHNEAQYIELVIESMIAQAYLPLKWVVVSDGSTDGTDEIVQRYQAKYPWIDLVRMPERRERHFAGKVGAFNAGYDRVKHLEFDVIGNLDGDVSFGPVLFELLLRRMAEDPQLGVAGAPFREGKFQYDFRFTNIENVWGGCQLFQARVLCCDRRLHATQGRLHRSCRGSFGAAPRMEDSDLYGECVHAPSADGNGAARRSESKVQARRKRLHSWQSSDVGGVQDSLSDETSSFYHRGSRAGIGLRLVIGAGGQKLRYPLNWWHLFDASKWVG